jgi:hypothetical protein
MQLLVSLFLLLSVWPAVAQESSSKSKPHGKPAAPAARETAETIYRNPDFGFTYKIPYAWIDRTKPMQDETADPSTSKLLLAVFERPPEVTGDTVNSAVVITAESATSYPGLKSAADHGPHRPPPAKGFKADGGPPFPSARDPVRAISPYHKFLLPVSLPASGF